MISVAIAVDSIPVNEQVCWFDGRPLFKWFDASYNYT